MLINVLEPILLSFPSDFYSIEDCLKEPNEGQNTESALLLLYWIREDSGAICLPSQAYTLASRP